VNHRIARLFAVAALVVLVSCSASSVPNAPTSPAASASAAASAAATTGAGTGVGAGGGVAIEGIPLWLSPTVHAVLWRPTASADRKPIALLGTHESADVTNASWCNDLSSRGFQILCMNGRFVNAQGSVIWDDLMLDVKTGVEYLRKQSDIKTVYLLGHSGGGAIVSYYQNVAENGVKVCQDPRRILPCSDQLANLPKADGVILVDPIPGLAYSTLTQTDAAVIKEDEFGQITTSMVDPSLDMFATANGYDAKKPTFSADFVKRFFTAEGARYNRLIALAQSRMDAIKAGKGWFPDDEPFIISRSNARLWVPDIDLVARTQQPHTIVGPNGERQEIAKSVRPVGTSARGPASNLFYSSTRTGMTVRSFLSTYAIRTTPDYQITADNVVGVDWQSTNTSLVANVGGFKSPLLALSMTGHYWLVTTEIAYNASPSADKTLSYIEGASHGLSTCKECETTPGQFGDTNKTAMDYIAKWLNSHR